MQYQSIKTTGGFLIAGFLLISAICCQKSEGISDKSAGLNGGFEHSKNNLPVNWQFYTPNTVSNAEFKISLDKNDFKEGLQSLKFEVNKCDSKGGHYSPGFTNEFFEVGKFEGKGTYKISFWYKNKGTRFIFKAGAVSAFEGQMKELLEGHEQEEEWRYQEFTIFIPKEQHLRLQLNILTPGSFWIDDVQVLKM